MRPLPLLLLLAACASGASGQDTPIPAIQGASHVSPLVGRTVTTRGIVTAVAHNGFYLQDPAGDGDDATSDAIFVFTRERPDVAAGDEIRVTGRVEEFVPGGGRTRNLSITQIAGDSAVPLRIETRARRRTLPAPVIIGRGGRVPPTRHVVSPDETPVDLVDPAAAAANRFDPEEDGADFFEALEGMRVVVRSPVAVSPTRTFSRHSSEVVTLPENGELLEPKSARTARGGVLLGADRANRGDQQPERVQIQFESALYRDPVPRIAVGDRLGDVTGVVGYSFGNYEVVATEPFEIRPSGLEPETTPLTGGPGTVTIATYNLHNLSARDEDDAQRAKLARQIVERLRSPHVLALQEIQDDNGETDDGTTTAARTLARLVAAIRDAGGPRYEAFDVAPPNRSSGGAPGANIRVAFLYDPVQVRRISYRALTPEVLRRAGVTEWRAFRGTRAPLEAVFEREGVRFTVIAVHFTSRSGSTPVFGAVQPFDQRGDDERNRQASAIHDYVASLVATTPDARIVVAGDLNTFEFTETLAERLPGRDGVLVPLSSRAAPGDAYSYIFEGNSQLLDHIFAAPALAQNAELDVVHVNADFPVPPGDVLASDHEPVVARFRLKGADGGGR